MNQFSARYRKTCGGYQALVRLDRDGFMKPVLGKGGMPIIFNSALSAQIAATDAVLAYINGNLRRGGERVCGARAAAEKVFAKRGAA